MGYWSELRAWLLKDPARVIRYLVLFICCIIVIVQLYECFSKLNNPPISTHAYYNLNDTIEMPAITICREPPYKEEELSLYECFSKLNNPPISTHAYYNLNDTIEMPAITICREPPYKEEELSRIPGNDCKHPKYSSCWDDYPYEDMTLSDFFANSTFNKTETFPEYLIGLNSLMGNVEITSNLNFYMGRCHTIRPKISLKRADKSTGYSIMLKHHLTRDEVRVRGKYYEKPPGWHLFIHDKRENFTEINMKASGRVEYVFADINEDIEIKLQSQYFSNVETKRLLCSRKEGYSDLKCGEACIWHEVGRKTNCSGPWMYHTHVPPCSTYKSMIKLIAEYGKFYNSDADAECDCMQPCVSRIFSAYVQNRKAFEYPEPFTQVYIYYTTKLISMIEERPSYDTTQFIADVGGSLGFLLGLSVLGLIGILEHITLFLCGGVLKRIQQKNEKRLKVNEDQDKDSETTVDIATVYKGGY